MADPNSAAVRQRGLQGLPTEVHLALLPLLDYESTLYLSQTCRRFYSLLCDRVHLPTWREEETVDKAMRAGRLALVRRAQYFRHNKLGGLLACESCLRLLPALVFGRAQKKPCKIIGRVCLMCGALNAPAPSPPYGAKRSKIERARRGPHYPNKDRIATDWGAIFLCWECGKWDTDRHGAAPSGLRWDPRMKDSVCGSADRPGIDIEGMAQERLAFLSRRRAATRSALERLPTAVFANVALHLSFVDRRRLAACSSALHKLARPQDADLSERIRWLRGRELAYRSTAKRTSVRLFACYSCFQMKNQSCMHSSFETRIMRMCGKQIWCTQICVQCRKEWQIHRPDETHTPTEERDWCEEFSY